MKLDKTFFIVSTLGILLLYLLVRYGPSEGGAGIIAIWLFPVLLIFSLGSFTNLILKNSTDSSKKFITLALFLVIFALAVYIIKMIYFR